MRIFIIDLFIFGVYNNNTKGTLCNSLLYYVDVTGLFTIANRKVEKQKKIENTENSIILEQ